VARKNATAVGPDGEPVSVGHAMTALYVLVALIWLVPARRIEARFASETGR